MIEIFGTAASRSFRIYWLLEELGLEYKAHPIKTDDKNLEKINPNKKIPALKDGDFLLFESAAIAYYICNKSEKQNLLPKESTKERALVDQWMFWCQSELEQMPWLLAKHNMVYPEELRVKGLEPAAKYEFEICKKILKQTLENKNYLVGGSFSVADIFISHTLNWAKRFDLINKSDAILMEYVDKNKNREAFNKARKLLNL